MPVDDLSVEVYEVPTEAPESDGTLTWDATTVIVVRAAAEGCRSLGFGYGTRACACLVTDVLRDAVLGADPMDVPASWSSMVRAIRNLGRPGICSMAIAAVDVALWDLKARILDVPLFRMLGPARDAVPVYGSGGFTSMPDDELAAQLDCWVHVLGIPRVKIKVGESWGTRPGRDLERVRLARRIIGDDAELYVDANGGYGRTQAVRMAAAFAESNVTWFEEPVSSDDLEGLGEIRRATAIDVAAGEYGYDLPYFARMAGAGAVDVLQADVSRCAGVTEWLRVAAVAQAAGLELSGHCAPSLHAHVGCAVPNLRHVEYFHDHARIDRLLFDGAPDPTGGSIRPDPDRPGLGMELKAPDAARFRVEIP